MGKVTKEVKGNVSKTCKRAACHLQGDGRNPGVVPRALQDVFDIIEKTPGRDFLLRLSMMEIYNEVNVAIYVVHAWQHQLLTASVTNMNKQFRHAVFANSSHSQPRKQLRDISQTLLTQPTVCMM